MIVRMAAERERSWRWAASVAASVADAATLAYPAECCGWLLGPSEGFITSALPAENDETPARADARYLLTPAAYRRAERMATVTGLEIVGVYHSHPDHTAQPSVTDEALAWPSWLYVIVPVAAGTPGAAQAWTLRPERNGFDAVALKTG